MHSFVSLNHIGVLFLWWPGLLLLMAAQSGKTSISCRLALPQSEVGDAVVVSADKLEGRVPDLIRAARTSSAGGLNRAAPGGPPPEPAEPHLARPDNSEWL